MADPLSILGAAAASAQFLKQGFDLNKFLWDLYSKMKDAPESIRNQIVQIEQLIGLSRLFLENKSLQTDSVASILSTCLLRAQEFRNLLKKTAATDADGRFVRVHQSLTAVMKEKEIAAPFVKLERDKSSLILCIQEIDA
jgi:hypothetical protein